jgi:hypothetical protein
VRVPVESKDELDELEERGYLDPDQRGSRTDECGAIELFSRMRCQNQDGSERRRWANVPNK